MKALIAGGGIAGMAAALAFARAGWEAEIFEQAPALGEVGAGLQLSPNACKVLDRLRVLPDIWARACVPEAAELRDGLTGIIGLSRRAGCGRRGALGRPLPAHPSRRPAGHACRRRGRAGGAASLGQAAAGAVSRPDSAALHFEAGGAAEGDVVVGADGIRSRLRGVIGPAESLASRARSPGARWSR